VRYVNRGTPVPPHSNAVILSGFGQILELNLLPVAGVAAVNARSSARHCAPVSSVRCCCPQGRAFPVLANLLCGTNTVLFAPDSDRLGRVRVFEPRNLSYKCAR